MVNQEVDIKSHFDRNFSLKIPDDWLKQCIEFLSEEFPDSSNTNYKDLIFTQLLNFDLNYMGTYSSLGNLEESGSIKGNYFLQIMLCVDSTESFFSKIQKLVGDINENVLVDADNVPSATQFERKDFKKNRMFTFFLTDGTNHMKAIEYKPISFLEEEILPGTKVKLKGPIQYRKNVLFLTPENIEILGGTVDELTTPEGFVKILHEEMKSKRKITNTEKVTKFKSTKPVSCLDNRSTSSSISQFKQENKQTQNLPTQSNTFSNQNQRNFNSIPQKFSNKNNNDDEDDDYLMNFDLNSITSKTSIKTEEISNTLKRQLSVEEVNINSKQNQIDKNTNMINNKKIKTGDNLTTNIKTTGILKENNFKNYDNDDDDDDFLIAHLSDSNQLLINQVSSNKNICNQKPIDSKSKENSQNFGKNQKENYYEKNKNLFMSEHHKEIEIKESNTNKLINYSPNYSQEKNETNLKNVEFLNRLVDLKFVEMCCLKNKSQTQYSTCIHYLRGRFATLTNKLSQSKLRWFQECSVTDDSKTIYLDAYIDDEPMTDLLGISCAEAKEIFKKVRQNTDHSAHDEFNRRKQICEQKLQEMSCLMNLKYDLEKKKFCIFKLENIEY